MSDRMRRFTQRELSTIENALRIAARQYEQDAVDSRKYSARVADQFERQANEAKRIEQAIEAEEVA